LFTVGSLATTACAGVAVSADGSTMFFNIYTPGITYAITGPWRRRR
jgi:secreted PhoX family phosphatase